MAMRKIKNIALIIIVISIHVFYSCGQSSLEIGENTYEPKIVIDGYLYPGQKVEKIKITRNIPVNTYPDPTALILSNSDVRISDLQNGKEYRLTFNPQKFYFEYNGSDLVIRNAKSYKLSVTSNIDGKSLSASSTTLVPRAGFRINDELSTDKSILYREADPEGNEKKISITFSPSPGTGYYFFSIVALNASDSSFIYNNPYVQVKSSDVIKNLDQYRYRFRWLQNVNSTGSFVNYSLEWINFWFYGDYRIIVYACDENFRLYNQTYRNVQEFDGNFHEPRMNINGDGIGIFGSAIADTLYIKVNK